MTFDFCTPWKNFLRHLFHTFKVIIKKTRKSFYFENNLPELIKMWSKYANWIMLMSAECCFFRKSRLSTSTLFWIMRCFSIYLFSLKFCSIFVGKNKVTRDFCPTPEHYWEGPNYLKVYIRVFDLWREEIKILRNRKIKME